MLIFLFWLGEKAPTMLGGELGLKDPKDHIEDWSLLLFEQMKSWRDRQELLLITFLTRYIVKIVCRHEKW